MNSVPGFQPLPTAFSPQYPLSGAHGWAKGVVLMVDALAVKLTEDYEKLRKDYVESLMVDKRLL